MNFDRTFDLLHIGMYYWEINESLMQQLELFVMAIFRFGRRLLWFLIGIQFKSSLFWISRSKFQKIELLSLFYILSLFIEIAEYSWNQPDHWTIINLTLMMNSIYNMTAIWDSFMFLHGTFRRLYVNASLGFFISDFVFSLKCTLLLRLFPTEFDF